MSGAVTTKRSGARKTRTADAKLRKRIELAVERLLSALDTLDAPAEDLEPEGDDGDDAGQDDEPDVDGEPSLGSVASHTGSSQQGWASGAGDDREDEHDGAEPDEDGEPGLGAFDRPVNQVKSWQQRACAWPGQDCEDDPADGPEGDDEREGLDPDNEPSLGAPAYISDGGHQGQWAEGEQLDRELDVGLAE
jgi:hypothetical protein